MRGRGSIRETRRVCGGKTAISPDSCQENGDTADRTRDRRESNEMRATSFDPRRPCNAHKLNGLALAQLTNEGRACDTAETMAVSKVWRGPVHQRWHCYQQL